MKNKNVSLYKCIKIVEKLKRQKKKIVMTNGCFDIIHSGHVDYLVKSKKLGDILIVAVNSDKSIKKLKGKSRPVNNLKNRIKVLNSMSFIDFIISFNYETPQKIYEKILPDILTKGTQYRKMEVAGGKIVIENGGKVSFIKMTVGQSTTKILNKILHL